MKNNTNMIVGVLVLVVIAGGVYASMSKKDDSMMDKKVMDDSAMMNKEGDYIKEDAMMKDGETGMMDKSTGKSEMMVKGMYESYAPEKLAKAESGDVVLFFHASWCPSCRALNADIEKNMNSIPEGVTILKVDYDKESEMKKKYGVTYQHTLVQVDKDGNMIKKWSGSPKLANLVSEIQ